MPLFYHAGALGDLLLAMPFLRALARLRTSSEWTLAVAEEPARLVSRIVPHRRRVAPGAVEMAPLTASAFEPRRVADLSSSFGGLFGFVPRAAEVEAIVRERCAGTPVALAEPFATAVKSGRSIEAVLKDVIERAVGERRALRPEDFAIEEGELPPRESARHRVRLDPPYALVHPGASDRAKQAPLAVFVDLARRFESQGLQVVWVHGPVEVERGDPMPPGPLLDRPDLIELAHAIAHADTYAGCDSGPTHLASALGVPTTAVHVVANAAWRPRGSRATVLEIGVRF
jgi:ADP-heptose:LPS heptosyltransferase